MVDSVIGDFRFAIRQLSKSKGFTATAVITLALGIGANTAIFTLVHAVMLKSLPVAAPEHLYRLGDSDNCCVIGSLQKSFSIYSYPLYLYLRDQTQDFEQMAAFQAGLARVGVRRASGNAAPEACVDQFVSGNYFTMLAIRPFAGRLLNPSDDQRGAPPAAVMSYAAWERRFGSDGSVVGRQFIIDGAPFTIVGIAAPGFFGDTLRPDPPDFWVPLASEPGLHKASSSLLDNKNDYWLYIIGRLKPNAQPGAAEARVNVEVSQWLAVNDPPLTEGAKRTRALQHVTFAPAGGGVATMRQNFARDLRLLTAIAGLVLLIACANLANLLLARGTAAASQTSIRVALGAPRARLVRERLVESIVLALMGGAAGLLVADELAGVLINLAFHGAKYVPIDSAPALPVLAFAFALSLITGIVFGIAPAWYGSRADPATALRGAGRSTRNAATMPQKSLIVAQAAVSLVLVACAALMIQTVRNLTDQRFGFESTGRLIVNVNAALTGYSPERLDSTYRTLVQRMKQIPAVRNASLSLYSPMEGNNWQSGIHTEERPDQIYSPSWDRVSAGFFDTIGAHIRRGRMFDDRDTPDSKHVAVVNQTFVDKVFPNEDAIGKRFGLGGIERRADYEIVGVVEDVRFRDPRLPAPPMFFVPLLQMSKNEWASNNKARSNIIGNIELHVGGKTPDLAAAVQRALAETDLNITMLELTSLDEQLENLLSHERLIARLAEMFGVLALILASVGLYGITAYSVARRTSEIGIRGALGATRGNIVRLILAGALGQIGLGLAIGIPATLAAGRLLSDQLYGVKSYDPVAIAGAALILGACACAAGIGPALRASSIDPVRALRLD